MVQVVVEQDKLSKTPGANSRAQIIFAKSFVCLVSALTLIWKYVLSFANLSFTFLGVLGWFGHMRQPRVLRLFLWTVPSHLLEVLPPLILSIALS